MNEQELQQVANDAATAFPGVTFEHRDDPNWEIYKVGGRIFLMMTDLPSHLVATVKANPDEAVVLREQYDEITPGYHADKKHWVSAAAGPGIDEPLIRRLVNDSYGLVVAGLPASARPETASRPSGRA